MCMLSICKTKYFIYQFVFSHTLTPENLSELSTTLPANSWLGNSSVNPCGLILAKYLHVHSALCGERDGVLEIEAQALVNSVFAEDSEVQVRRHIYNLLV